MFEFFFILTKLYYFWLLSIMKIYFMQKILGLLLILCFLVCCKAEKAGTLRVDITLSGVLDSCRAEIAAKSYWDKWDGPSSSYDAESVMGNFIYSLYRCDGDSLISVYKDGFSSLYYEWATMEYEGKSLNDIFEHTLVMPYVSGNVRLVVELRRGNNLTVVLDELFDTRDVRELKDNAAVVRCLNEPNQVGKSTLDIAVVAEGYTAEEEELFWSDVSMLSQGLLTEPAFAKYSDCINVRGLFMPSTMSGPSDPQTGYVSQTPLSSSFGTFGSDRYLQTLKTFALYDYVGSTPADVIVVLVNSDKYGGGGVYNCFAIGSTSADSWIEVLLHEIGHSFAGLADEYYYPNEVQSDMYPLDAEPWELNITTMVDFASKWKALYDKGSTGLIEGAAYQEKGVYRSEPNCKMRELYVPFCTVCNDATEKRIKHYIE
jgi:hypothetical protein